MVWNASEETMSRLVSPSDVFFVAPKSLFSNVDVDILFDFYAPIVSSYSVLLYLLLWRQKEKGRIFYRDFFSRYQLGQQDIVNRLPSLEAIGLVKTFYHNEGERGCYRYELYAPRTPNEFFSNELLNGLLVRFVDEKERNALKKKYVSASKQEEGYEEISVDFSSFFQIDSSCLPPLDQNKGELISRESAPLKLYFDKNILFKALSKELPDVLPGDFSSEEIIRVARISTLNNLDEEAMASLIAFAYRPERKRGEKIDLPFLKERALEAGVKGCYWKKGPEKTGDSHAFGNSSYAKMMRRADETSPIAFLSKLQKGHKPPQSDLRLLDRLVNDIGLSQGATNALIFYVLIANDNHLNPNYVEKIASTLVRKGIDNALDAWNYLNEQKMSKGKKKSVAFSSSSLQETPKEKEEASEEDDYEAVLNSL